MFGFGKKRSVLIDDINFEVKNKSIYDLLVRFKFLVGLLLRFDDLHRDLFIEEMNTFLDNWSKDLNIKI